MRLVTEASEAVPMRFRLTNDLTAPVYGQLSPDQTHPYPQSQLVPDLNKRLPRGWL